MELLRNAALYDPAPRGRADLLVAGETIVWIGSEAPALSPSLGVEEQDLEGRTTAVGVLGYHLPPATVTGSVRQDIVLIDLILGVGELASETRE